jgi:hypothetical protein
MALVEKKDSERIVEGGGESVIVLKIQKYLCQTIWRASKVSRMVDDCYISFRSTQDH